LNKKEKLINYNNQKLITIEDDNIKYNDELQNLDEILLPSINLYKYQMQDIQWMKEIETNIANNTNTISYDYSPTYKVLNDTFILYNNNLLPSELLNVNYNNTVNFKYYGGNIISQVGLGKTLIALCHSLLESQESRKRYSHFVEFGNMCNYFYKRGMNKSKMCNKEKENESLYCKEHKKTLFDDKRVLNLKNLQEFDLNEFKHMLNNTDKFIIKTNSTLIICPNQLCDQWIKEFYSKFKNDKRILLIVTYDQYTNLTLADILFSDIVVISYNFLLNKKYTDNINKDPNKFLDKNFTINETDDKLQSISNLLNSKIFNTFNLFHWNRIICDEAHEIQNMARSNVLKSIIKSFECNYKWNITGTPFANGLNSFVNLMSYNTNFYDTYNSNIYQNYNSNNLDHLDTSELISLGFDSDIIDKCRVLFRKNTKDSIKNEYSGNILDEYVKLLTFTEQEKNIYDSYLEGSRSKYSEFLIKLCCHSELNNDTKELIKNCKTFDEIQKVMLDYNKQKLDIEQNKLIAIHNDIEYLQNEISKLDDANIDDQMVQLQSSLSISRRQYTISKKNYETVERTYNYLTNAINGLKNRTEEMTCPICLDDIEENSIAITKCGHKFCWDCLYQTHNMNKETSNTNHIKCPTCNTIMNTKDIYLLNENMDELDNNCEELSMIINKVKSTKIGNIIYFLKTNILPGDKIILFSQWDELLHKVGDILKEYGLNLTYCNGTVYQRKRAIDAFTRDQNINLIMLSSRNAASGINLTAANKIILLEPVYGSQEYRYNIESQAIGRADRLGQDRPIEIYRFIIRDSIEEDILNNFIDDTKIKQLNI
jgi:SNF2 family DNA or RNA helicase